jgi:2-polyprenyl-3-methyl-5-hydroxy-6-metoxy-1,4-benzoquinol methylase
MADEQAEFWSKVAQRYDRVADLQIGGKTRSLVWQRVVQEGTLGRLVEFGCGTGFYTNVLASKADTVLATDISPGMLELAKQHVKVANVTFRPRTVSARPCQTQHMTQPSSALSSTSPSLPVLWLKCTASSALAARFS